MEHHTHFTLFRLSSSLHFIRCSCGVSCCVKKATLPSITVLNAPCFLCPGARWSVRSQRVCWLTCFERKVSDRGKSRPIREHCVAVSAERWCCRSRCLGEHAGRERGVPHRPQPRVLRADPQLPATRPAHHQRGHQHPR